uniref:Family with sequence similarity 110 member C n=1 Tax=Apteryx owenii TaxID=8824 RepID=A0A8B9P2Q2_APTOW
MPTEICRAVGMHAISDFHSSPTARLLRKGPEYLRQQLEAGPPGRKSAVERLAADKAKYVKSQQVISTKQEPVIALSSASESSGESCSAESKNAARARGGGTGAPGLEPAAAARACHAPLPRGPPIARRSTPRRQMRPDSLVIYRQKCEFVRGHSQDGARGSLVRRLFQGPPKEKQLAPPEMPGVIMESKEPVPAGRDAREPSDPGAERTVAATAGAPCVRERERPSELPPASEEGREVKRRGLHRSQSDISSRYSKSFSEFDTFFKYCGLEPEVVEDLGRENFSTVSDNISFKVRSISVATSESNFTRHSGDDGLLEDELTEQVPSSTSVIERNARIIKWLYTCKKAKEANPVLRELA